MGQRLESTSIKRSVNFTPEMLQSVEKLAIKKNMTTSGLIREYIEKGLAIEGYSQDLELIAQIVRQEVNAVYHVEDIRNISGHDTDRIAKMIMKTGKINAAMFFLLIKVLMSLAKEGSEDDFDRMLSESIELGVDYMQKKDFQINSFLQDTDNLRKNAEKL